MRATGQCTHFVGDHGKTTPGLTGTGRFNGRVQRQKVGLLGNRTDHPEYADNRRYIFLQAVERHAAAANVVHQRMNFHDTASYHALGGLAFFVGLLGSDRRVLCAFGHFLSRR
ncbi:hypothetical protein D3C86_1979570 [compost metagenome]